MASKESKRQAQVEHGRAQEAGRSKAAAAPLQSFGRNHSPEVAVVEIPLWEQISTRACAVGAILTGLRKNPHGIDEVAAGGAARALQVGAPRLEREACPRLSKADNVRVIVRGEGLAVAIELLCPVLVELPEPM
jgi:hypothetical protein